MRLATDVSLVVRPARDGVPQAQVQASGQLLGAHVSGSILEAAVRCGRFLLLFVTDDVPDEEMLSNYLIGDDGAVLDAARLGGPYTTGFFADLRLEPPSTVRFRFIDHADWAVHVLKEFRLCVPFLPDAKGVWRGAAFKRHFVVRRR